MPETWRQFVLPFVMTYHLLKSFVLMFVPYSMLPMKQLLPSDVILITGGAMGLGKEMAINFIKHGAKSLVLWDLNADALEKTKNELQTNHVKVYTYVVDVTDRHKVYSEAEKVKNDVGMVTYLVNNAGIVSARELCDIPDEMIEKTFAVNAISHFWTLKAFLPDMIKSNRGHVVTIASMAGHAGLHYLTDYCASKFAAVGTHEALRAELACKGVSGVDLTCICPYFINTGMFAGVSARFLEQSDVARDTVLAVLTRQDTLLLPSSLKYVILLSKIFSTELNAFSAPAFIDQEAMATFVGRNKSK